jgi:hypothetical protein
MQLLADRASSLHDGYVGISRTAGIWASKSECFHLLSA